MKKILAVIVAVTMLVSLAGCKNGNSTNDNKSTQAPAETTEATSTPAPAKEAEVTTVPELTDAPAATQAPEDEGLQAGTTEGTETEATDVFQNPEQSADKVNMDEALITYILFLQQYTGEYSDEAFEEVKYALGFIDEDDIPELFVSDGYYHAYGTKIFKYVDKEVVPVGEFGEFGGFAFTPRMNNIYSYYYGMGVGTNLIYSMNPDGSVENKASFEIVDVYDYENDIELGTQYFVKGEEVEEAEYDEAISKYYYDDVPNMVLSYDDNFATFADTIDCIMDVMKYMLDKAQKNEKFTGFVTPEMEAMVGEWELVWADIHDVEHEVFVAYDADQVNSSITISSDYRMSYWLSAWVLDDGEDNIFHCDYYLPMNYHSYAIYDGVENDEYFIQCRPEYGDSVYDFVLFTDSEGVETLELVEFYGADSNIIAYYHRVDTAEPVGTAYFGVLKAYPELTRNDGTECYLFEEYMWITEDTDPEIIAAYGFAPDLDGYDYEIVKLDKEPMVVYGSQFGPSAGWPHYTCYRLMSYRSMQSEAVDYETFYNAVASTYDGMFVNLFLEDGSDVANYIEEEYTG